MTAAIAINIVRTRAGLANVATGLTATQFADKLENERFVELAFEGHRFYDLRRWKKAGDIKYRTIETKHIVKNSDGTFTETINTDVTTRA